MLDLAIDDEHVSDDVQALGGIEHTPVPQEDDVVLGGARFVVRHCEGS